MSTVEGSGGGGTFVLSDFATGHLSNEEDHLECCVCQDRVFQGQEALTTTCPCTPDLSVGHSECFISAATYRANRQTLIMQCFANAHPVHLGLYDDDVFPPMFFDAVSHFGDDLEVASNASGESTDSVSSTASKLKKKETIWVLPPLEDRQRPDEEEESYHVSKEEERQEMYDHFGDEHHPCFRPWKSRHAHEILDRFGQEHDEVAQWKIRAMQRTMHRFGGTPPDTDEDFGDIPRNFFLYEGAKEHNPHSDLSLATPEVEYDDDAASTTADAGWDDLDLSEWDLQVVPMEKEEEFHTPTGNLVEVSS